MSPRDDDNDVRRPLSDREADALLRGPELAGFVAELQGMASQAPAPSAALAALLSGGLVPDVTPTTVLPSVRRRRWTLVPVPLAVLLVGGTIGAASANVLPDGAQRVVSDTVSSITPIHLPKPADKPKPTPGPSASQGDADEPGEDAKPTEHPTPRPSARPTEADDGQDGDHQGNDSVPTPQRTPDHDSQSPEPGDGHGGDDDHSGEHHEDSGSTDHERR